MTQRRSRVASSFGARWAHVGGSETPLVPGAPTLGHHGAGVQTASALPVPDAAVILTHDRPRPFCGQAVGTDVGVKSSGQTPGVTSVSCIPVTTLLAVLDDSLQQRSLTCGVWTGLSASPGT